MDSAPLPPPAKVTAPCLGPARATSAPGELGETRDPRTLVTSDPNSVFTTSSSLTQYGQLLGAIRDDPQSLDSGSGEGCADEAFQNYLDGEFAGSPPGLRWNTRAAPRSPLRRLTDDLPGSWCAVTGTGIGAGAGCNADATVNRAVGTVSAARAQAPEDRDLFDTIAITDAAGGIAGRKATGGAVLLGFRTEAPHALALLGLGVGRVPRPQGFLLWKACHL